MQSVDVFKVHLDQFWAQQEVMFDWTADLLEPETDQSTQLLNGLLTYLLTVESN